MIATTPRGTRTFWISSPLGRRQPSRTSPTGSGQRGDVPQAGGHGPDAVLREAQAVERSGLGAGGGGGVEVGAVGCQDLGGPLLEDVRRGEQGGILGPGRGGGEDLRGGPGPPAHLGHSGDGHGPSIILDRPVKYPSNWANNGFLRKPRPLTRAAANDRWRAPEATRSGGRPPEIFESLEAPSTSGGRPEQARAEPQRQCRLRLRAPRPTVGLVSPESAHRAGVPQGLPPFRRTRTSHSVTDATGQGKNFLVFRIFDHDP